MMHLLVCFVYSTSCQMGMELSHCRLKTRRTDDPRWGFSSKKETQKWIESTNGERTELKNSTQDSNAGNQRKNRTQQNARLERKTGTQKQNANQNAISCSTKLVKLAQRMQYANETWTMHNSIWFVWQRNEMIFCCAVRHAYSAGSITEYRHLHVGAHGILFPGSEADPLEQWRMNELPDDPVMRQTALKLVEREGEQLFVKMDLGRRLLMHVGRSKDVREVRGQVQEVRVCR